MTKLSLEAQLKMIENLSDQIVKLKDDILSNLYLSSESKRYQIEEMIGRYMASLLFDEKKITVEEMLKEMVDKEIIDPLKYENEKEFDVPSISVNPENILNAEVLLRLADGGTLCAYTDETDNATRQVGILYKDTDGYGIDLALVEVKRGEIASDFGLKEDNNDIDIYVWADPSTDDFTLNCHIPHDDIVKAMQNE